MWWAARMPMPGDPKFPQREPPRREPPERKPPGRSQPGEDAARPAGGQTAAAEWEVVRAIEAYGSGVRSTLRHNATAYGFSISITAAYGLVASSHQQMTVPLQTLLFAGGSVAAFLLVEVVASRLFQRRARPETESVIMISGVVDALSVLTAVGVASALSLVPGIGSWPLTAFGATLAYLLIGGVDVLIARRIAKLR